VDAVVTSLPWGGPRYERQAIFDARDLCGRETDGMAAIIWMARTVAPRVVLHIPMNIDKAQVRVTQYRNNNNNNNNNITTYTILNIDPRDSENIIFWLKIDISYTGFLNTYYK
jgi:hypothetical protein